MVPPVIRASLLSRSLVVSVALAASLVVACGSTSSGDDDGSSGGSGVDGGRPRGPTHPAASCPVTIQGFDTTGGGMHVAEGTPVTYNSNPPSSGPHYPVWANFQEFKTTFDDGYLVHSLEHGAVALLYKCDPASASCAPTIDALRKIRDAFPTDPSCDSSIRVRIIVAPYPKLDVPVAAAAWGFTYKADCVDVPTLTQFAKDNYALSPENLCAPGRAF